MTSEDVIRMARGAGLDDYRVPKLVIMDFSIELAAAVRAEEREACARVCDDLAAQDKLSNYYAVAAKAIRARGQK